MQYDAIILGGGPGGSTTASVLARAGRKVLVLEKEKFPRFHIGESLLPYNRRIFDEIGVLNDIKTNGFMVKEGAQFWLGNGKKQIQVVFRDGSFNEETSAFQVERSTFDEMLLNNSRKNGATVQEECAVHTYEIGADGVTVTYRDATGAEQTAAGKFLIDATGQANFTGNREQIREFAKGHKKLAIFNHFKGVRLQEGERGGDIIVVRMERGWFWVIPLSPEKVSVGLVMEADAFKADGDSMEAAFQRAVDSSAPVREIMANAEVVGKWRLLSDWTYRNRRLVSPRLMRVGDAAGFMDPIFSSGVYLAMTSGRDAARIVDDALKSGQALTRGMKKYEKTMMREMDLYWQLITNYYTTPFVDLIMTDSAPLKMRCAIVSVLAGRLQQSWSVRWRLWLFYLLVKLQRRFPIAPRTDFA